MPSSAGLELSLADPTLARCELPKHARFFPYGFTLDLHTNSDAILRAAQESWGLCKQAFKEEPVRLELGVNGAGPAAELPPVYRSRGHVMSINGGQANSIVCDFRSSFAFGWVTEATAARTAELRYSLLESSVLTLLEQRYLAPLHAGLISLGDRGVLLCGDSFAGKSTLSYACARAGWTYVCDDGTELIRRRQDCAAVGDSQCVRLREDAIRFFPELQGWPASVRPNGKVGIEVVISQLPIKTANGCEIHHILILERDQSSQPLLLPYEWAAMSPWFEQYLWFGQADVNAEMRETYDRLHEATLHRFRYSNLDAAVALLTRFVREGF